MVAHFSARSIQVSIAGRRATPTSGERLIAEPLLLESEPLFIGIDVSKSWIDIADTCGRALRVANEETAIAAAFKGPCKDPCKGPCKDPCKDPWSSCADMVCEATGGYERALMRVAKQRGLPLRRVHPNRARAFGQMTARLGLRPTRWMRECWPNSPLSPPVSRACPCRPPDRWSWPTWSAASAS
jgi:hypothetical protein